MAATCSLFVFLLVEERGISHRLRSRVAGTAIEEGAGLRNGRDEILGANDPAHAPARKTEALGQAVDENDIVLVDVVEVRGARDRLAQVLVVRVLVPRIELVEDNGRLVRTKLDEITELFALNNLARRVTSWKEKARSVSSISQGWEEVRDAHGSRR